jgi:hypothetical protein
MVGVGSAEGSGRKGWAKGSGGGEGSWQLLGLRLAGLGCGDGDWSCIQQLQLLLGCDGNRSDAVIRELSLGSALYSSY